MTEHPSGGDPAVQDPFGTAALRKAVLQAWEASPTRFREDANAEEDLRLGGYRDRLLVELAQNAADAAEAADSADGTATAGVLRLSVVDGELRAANTGGPLTGAGVAGLASLRASAKRGGESVGRFGVGFAAVLAVSDEPRLLSTTGSVAFSADRTREEVAALAPPGEGNAPSVPAEELQRRAGGVPILRLVWPVDERPPEGFDTEVRLPLRSDVDGAELLEGFAAQASDLLLALPALGEVRVGAQSWRRHDLDRDRVVVHGPHGSDRWLVHRRWGELGGASEERAEEHHGTRWSVCWAVSLSESGAPVPLAQDVLYAPTPTEERLSVPARLLASVPLEPDRRRASASSTTEAVLVFAAECYSDLITKVEPQHRSALVPLPGFPLSDVDDKLRQAVVDRLRVAPWLPTAQGGVVAAHAARVLDQASPELVELLGPAVPGLLSAEFSEAAHRRSLSALDVRRLGSAEVVEAVTGLDRPASWWYRLYDALAPIERTDTQAREEFVALPVPLADGRTVTGVRDVLLSEGDSGPVATLSTLDISGLRIADPEAVHPMLERLGAHRAEAGELLDAPALVDAVRGSVADARSGADVLPLAEAVLSLVDSSRSREWTGALALPDSGGDHRRADELLLPDSPLLQVFDEEAIGEGGPLAVLDADFAQRWPDASLRAIGVGDRFTAHVEEDPVEPDDEFPDVERWWADQEAARGGKPPARFVAVRDLDLVADDAWPHALQLLTGAPDTLDALREPGGYPAWWIARFAVLGGRRPRDWRLPDAEELAGLYEPVPDVGLEVEQLRMAGVRAVLSAVDTEDAVDLVARLGNQERTVRAGTALRAHRVLAEAVATGVVDTAQVQAPDAVRSISGAVVGAERAAVLDEPWMLGVVDAPLTVAGGSPDQFDAEALAELLDLPLTSEEGALTVRGEGRVQNWRDVGRVANACELVDLAVPEGRVELHDVLRVEARSGAERVHWWVDPSGGVHAERTPDGLSRALAWAAGAWNERFALAALLADPEAATLLR